MYSHAGYYPNVSDHQLRVRPTGWCRCSAPRGWASHGVPHLPLVSQWGVHCVHGPVPEAAEGLRHVQRRPGTLQEGPGGGRKQPRPSLRNTRPGVSSEFLMTSIDHSHHFSFGTPSIGGTDSMFGFFYLPPGAGGAKCGQIPPKRARGSTSGISDRGMDQWILFFANTNNKFDVDSPQTAHLNRDCDFAIIG